MKLTAQDYRNAARIGMEWFNPNASDFQEFCKSKIAELEKPARKRYRCIKNSFPFSAWEVGETYYESTGDVEYSEHPFHFEEIIPEPIAAPVTIQDIFDCLESESSFVSNSLSKLFRQAINEGNVEV